MLKNSITRTEAEKILADYENRATMSHDFILQKDGSWKPLHVLFKPGDAVFVSHVEKLEERRQSWPWNEDVWGIASDVNNWSLAVVGGQTEDPERFGVLLANGKSGFCSLRKMRKAARSYASWLENIPTVGG